LIPKVFYCPGIASQWTDGEEWANTNSLWNFGAYRVVGYALIFNQGSLYSTNQNTKMLPEPITVAGRTIIPPITDRELTADATISQIGQYSNPLRNSYNYTQVTAPAGSGFMENGVQKPHLSPHLNGNLPAGGNIGFKDGHVEWRNFINMSQRVDPASNYPGFWW
jgi:hypothetical protein